MGHLSVTVLASEEGGETSNFLIPNGTFFFVLAIFLIVLGVIGKFVVPPIQKVLGERERMIAKTAEDNRKATEQEAAAIRDEARSEGRAVIDGKRAVANEVVAGRMQEANEALKLQSDALAPELRASAETLSATLASRVLGVDVSGSSASAGR